MHEVRRRRSASGGDDEPGGALADAGGFLVHRAALGGLGLSPRDEALRLIFGLSSLRYLPQCFVPGEEAQAAQRGPMH